MVNATRAAMGRPSVEVAFHIVIHDESRLRLKGRDLLRRRLGGAIRVRHGFDGHAQVLLQSRRQHVQRDRHDPS